MKIVVIGGSIVNGFPVKAKDSWVGRWSASTEHEIVNKGVNGCTADRMAKRFYQDVIAEKPDCAMMLFGTKDIATKGGEVEQVFDTLQEMVELCKKNDIKPVVGVPLLISEPVACENMAEDLGVDYNGCIDPEEANGNMRRFRELILDAAGKKGFEVIDLQGEFENAIAGKDSSQFYADGLKLNAKGHKLVYNIIKKSSLSN